MLPDNCIAAIKWDNDSEADHSDSNKINGIDRSKISIFCASCKPGFKIEGGKDVGEVIILLFVGKCEPID